MNKEKVLDGLQALLEFTDQLSAHQINSRASFAGNDQTDMITPANEKEILRQAEAQARLYSEARNKHVSPKSLIGLDAGLVGDVKKWVATRGKRMRG